MGKVIKILPAIVIGFLLINCSSEKYLPESSRAKIKASETIELIRDNKLDELYSKLSSEHVVPKDSFIKDISEIQPVLASQKIDTTEFTVSRNILFRNFKYRKYTSFQVSYQFRDSKSTPDITDRLDIYVTVLGTKKVVIDEIKVINSTPVILDIGDLEIPVQIKNDTIEQKK